MAASPLCLPMISKITPRLGVRVGLHRPRASVIASSRVVPLVLAPRLASRAIATHNNTHSGHHHAHPVDNEMFAMEMVGYGDPQNTLRLSRCCALRSLRSADPCPPHQEAN